MKTPIKYQVTVSATNGKPLRGGKLTFKSSLFSGIKEAEDYAAAICEGQSAKAEIHPK